jgi:hypothetical protein
MYVVKLSGGLGNQMFQFAFGQHLAKISGGEVKYEISYFKNPKFIKNVTTWDYELNKLNINVPIIKHDFFSKLEDLNRANKIKFVLFNMLFNFKNSFFIVPESKFELFQKIPLFKKNRFFIGYWQSEVFFEGIENNISNWFVLKDEFKSSKKNQKNLSTIINSNSISIGVRRGDHVKLNSSSNLNYYHKAIEIISKEIDNPFYVIFSDDIDWCKENLIINHKHIFINANKTMPFEDMELMSKCKHNIISNSTFNWWGAYLNQNKDKIVISPKSRRILNCLNFIQI